MELRQLQCFVECARTQSFSQAAALLYTSQSNVSKMISSLEEEFGQKLFLRKQRGIILTEKGRQVYQYALNIVECSDKLMDCMNESTHEELHISFQPSNWFSIAFCDYFIQNRATDRRYFLKSATVDEIVRRLSNNLDQLGFAYIEKQQLIRLEDIFQKNHIGYIELKRTKTVLCHGDYSSLNQEQEPTISDYLDIPLIQNFDDEYSGLAAWRSQLPKLPQIMITTDSDYIMTEIMRRTNLTTICSDYLSHKERSMRQNTTALSEDENILYLCMFRDNSVLEEAARDFLAFIKQYIHSKV